MKKIIKALKILIASVFTIYSALIIYFIVFAPKENRYDYAAYLQGAYLSQSMFEILKFQDPSNSNIYFEQSVAFNKRGNYEKGFKLLDKAVELDPKMHLGYRGYMKLRFLRDYKATLEDLNLLDSITPNVIDTPWGEDINFLRGEAYYGLEEYEKAISHFEKSIENQGEEWVDIQAFNYLGRINIELGNYEEAISFYNRALNQSKYSCEAHIGLAKIGIQNGEIQLAKDHLAKAEAYFNYKRNDAYNEYLNEVYKADILLLKEKLKV